MTPAQLRLYLVTDRSLLAHDDLLSLLPALVEAGVTAVQLRDKDADTRALLEQARDALANLELSRDLPHVLGQLELASVDLDRERRAEQLLPELAAEAERQVVSHGSSVHAP